MTSNTNENFVVLSPEGLDMNAALTPVIDKKVIAAIKTAIGGDRITAPTYDEAMQLLANGMEKTNNYANLPIVSYRPEAFEGKLAVVATVGQRVKESVDANGEKIPATNGIRAIVVFPNPTLDSYYESEEGKVWLAKLAEREGADVGFSGIRAAESVMSLCGAVGGMPIDIDTITRETRNNAIDDSVFSDNWQAFKDAFVEKNPTFKEDGMFPPKPLWFKAIRSKSFAAEHPQTQALESRGLIVKIASLFVATLKTAKDPKTGEALNLDTSVIEGWIADREKVNLSAGAKPKEESLDNLELSF